MTSRSWSRALAAGLTTTLSATLLLTGCAVGRPLGFQGRTNSFCADAQRSIAKLTAPSSPLEQIRYATDRYTALEKTVSELTDSSLPSGSTGQELRTRWLRPARASLAAGRAELATLQRAVTAGDIAAATRSFQQAVEIGTAGVDVGLLKSQGLDVCASVFNPS